jgi:hypothetical protein
MNTSQVTQTTTTIVADRRKYVTWGGAMNNPIHNNVTRLYYKNINGIGTRNLSNGFVGLYKHLQKTESAIGCFTEPNVDWNQYWIKQTNEDHGRELFHNALFSYSCNKSLSKKAYKPGGTMTISSGQLASRHLETGTDSSGMGRFNYQTFNGANGSKIIFITAYRVCFQTIENAGETTSFFHQWHNLLQDGHETPNPRRQVLLDLKEIILTRIGQGYDVCVSMDANEELNSRNNQLTEWMEQCGLLSVHENFFDTEYYDTCPIPSTYDRGPKKIDYVLCTPRLLSCVENVTIEAMNEGSPSDHRGLIVDFNTDKLLGKTSNIAKHKTRVLKSISRKGSGQYREVLHKSLLDQNIFGRVESLIRIHEKHGVMSKRGHHEAEQIDKYITDCMIKAENSIKVYLTEDFSPQKVKRADLEKFWKMAQQAVRKAEQTPTPPMSNIMNKYPEEEFTNLEENDHINERLKECREDYKQAIENSKEIRRKFLAERAEIARLNGDITAEAAITQLMHIEASITVYASIRVMNPSEYRSGLTMLKVPKDNGEFETIVDTKEIEERLLKRNQQHYAQAEKTEMASTETRSLMGPSGTTEFCDNVLNGTADLSSFSPSLKAIFQQLENPPDVEVSDKISYDDFKDALKCWKEKTSTSPSGRHLGHYISLMVKIGNETDILGEQILELHHKMLQIAQYRRRPYNRWKKETEVMLEKDPGDPKIDRLRIICLYEADYNLYLKIMWAHRMVKTAENNNLFDDSQSGGRPRRTSNDVALRKMLTYTYSRITRTSFASMDLDAKSCFDRIMASFGMLCSRFFGMPKSACELHGLTIHEMQHHVKTALGISSAFFQSTPEKVLYGSGQGSCGSPPLWMTISIVMFRALEARMGKGAYYACPRKQRITSHTTEAWVDDSNDYINDFLSVVPWNELELCENLRQQNQEWEKLLSASGGRLELPKCLAYIIVYDFVNGEPVQRPKEHLTARLYITDSESQRQTRINIKDPKESHKTLGTHQNPAGDPTGQAKVMAVKEERMRRAFQYMNFPMYKVHLAYNSVYTKSLQFPLGVTLMSYETAHGISKSTVKAIIGAMKLNRSSPRVLAFAPKELMGLGLCHHYTAQGKAHLKQIVQHVRQQDQNGQMYNMIFDFAQLIAGTQFPILQFPNRRLPQMAEPFICEMRKFLTKCSMNMVITDVFLPSALRIDDVNLMTAAMEVEKNDQAIRRFNQVRLYLQVTWLSEICNIPGTKLLPECLEYTAHTEDQSKSTLLWPVQGLPPKKSWTDWKYILRKRFLTSKTGRLADTSLEINMGDFFPITFNHRRWKWELTSPTTMVENVFAHGIRQKKYQIADTRGSRGQYAIIISNFEWIEDADLAFGYPVELVRQSGTIKTFLRPRAKNMYNLHKVDTPISSKFINVLTKSSTTRKLSNWEKENLSRTRMTICVTSKQWGERTDFGWSICYRRGDTRPFFGGGAGSVMITTSFSEPIMGELYAARAAINTLRRTMSTTWSTTPLKLTILSTNESTITTLEKLDRIGSHNPRWRLNRNWELLQGLSIDLGNQSLKLKLARKDYELHDRSIEDADRRIIAYQQRQGDDSPKLQPTQPLGRAYLRKGYKIVNDYYDREIILEYSWPDFSKHLRKKFNWSKAVFESVNWKAFGHEAKTLTITRRTNLLKYIYEWLPIGKMLQRIDSSASPKCPSCDCDIEKPEHLFWCPTVERQLITSDCINNITASCEKWKLPTNATKAIKESIQFWIAHPNSSPPYIHIVHQELQDALRDQARIGWNNFLKGFIATKFQAIANRTREGPLNAFEQIRWTCEIIKPIWAGELDHWNLRNKDRHGHTPEEEAEKKRERLLQKAHELVSLKNELDPQYRTKIFPSWERIKLKRTNNLEQWIETTAQSVHYLLNVNNQADDDPPPENEVPTPSVPPLPDPARFEAPAHTFW